MLLSIARLQAQLHALASDPTTYTKDPDPQVPSYLPPSILNTSSTQPLGCLSRGLDILPGHGGARLATGRDLGADDQQRPCEEALQQPCSLNCTSQAILGEVLLQGMLIKR